MEYRNAPQKNGIYYYPNDQFYTISIQLNFLANGDNQDAATLEVLRHYLTKCNQCFASKDDIDEKEEELYSLSLYFSNQFLGGFVGGKVFGLHANLISPSLLQEDYSQEAFAFIRDILQKPDFTNEEMLAIVKRTLISDMQIELSENDDYAEALYNQMVFPNEDRKFSDSVDIQYISSMINSVTLEDLERVYHSLMSHFHSGFVFGNATEEQFEQFANCMQLTPCGEEISHHVIIPTVEGDMEIPKDSEQSYIYVTFDIDNLHYSQLRVLHYLLNSTLGLCYQTLREKYHLVYHASAEVMYYDGKLSISAEIDKKKKKRFLKAVDEIIRDLQDPEKLAELMVTAKSEYFSDNETFEEDSSLIIDSISDYLLGLYDGLDKNEVDEGIQDLTSGDLLQKTKTIQKKNVFMVRSDPNESV